MNTADTSATPIRSALADDLDLAPLVEMFVDEMPQRVETLRGFKAAEDWQGVARVAHQLKGAAGSYGFHELTPYAARLEAAVRHEQASDRAAALLEALVDACGRVCAG
jgi:HPt (histidine-containing phosphotransfer) domain-containing protein